MARTVDLAELLERSQDSRVADLWTAAPGIVEKYDATTRTADVRVATKRPVTNVDTGATEHEELPVLPSVPVLFPSSPFGGLSWPIPKGSTGLLVFLTYSAGAWQTGAADGATPRDPGDLRTHHPAHAVFVPGLVPDTASTPRTAENALVIEGAEVRLGTFDASDPVAGSTKTNARLDALEDFAANHTHGGVTAGGASTAAAVGFTPGAGDVASPTVKVPA